MHRRSIPYFPKAASFGKSHPESITVIYRTSDHRIVIPTHFHKTMTKLDNNYCYILYANNLCSWVVYLILDSFHLSKCINFHNDCVAELKFSL